MGFIVAFLLFSHQQTLYMIQHNSDLSYDIHNTINDIHNTINKQNRRQNHYLLSIINYLDIYF